MRLPDFLVIGAMKAGTTSLYGYLQRHPGIFMPGNKEPQFFSIDERYARGLPGYAALFEGAKPDQLCGEASTCYSRAGTYPEAARRIREALPNVKLIYLVRHPVDRLYSHYRHRMQERVNRGGEIIPVDEYIASDPEAFDASLYMRQINVFLDAGFPKEQLLVAFSEDLTEDPAPTLDQVLSFLDLPLQDLVQGRPVHLNAVGRTTAKITIRNVLRDLRQRPVIKPLADLVPSDFRGWLATTLTSVGTDSVIGKRIGERFASQTPKMTPATRANLITRFAPSVDEFAEWTGRELSEWRK